MDLRLLGELGLTKGEIKTYLFLITRPQSSVSQISGETKLNRSNLYSILENLINKNLVTSTIIDNVKYFSANEPTVLREIIEKKISDLNKKKLDLNEFIQNADKLGAFASDVKVEFYQGNEGIKNILEKILQLKRGETVYSLGYENLFERRFKYYFKKFKTERVRKGIQFKAIFKKTKRTKSLKIKLTEIKYLDLQYFSNVEISIYKNSLTIFFVSENTKVLHIESEALYKHMLNYFNFLWELSE